MKELGKEGCIELYRVMVRIREFEEKIRFLFLEGKMPGTIHQHIGMEACAVCPCTGKNVCSTTGTYSTEMHSI